MNIYQKLSSFTLLLLFSFSMMGQASITRFDDMKKKSQKAFKKAKKAAFVGDFDEAIKQYTKVLDNYPDMQESLLNLGGLYLQIKDYTVSESYFKKALANEAESNPLIHFSLGIIKKEEKAYEASASHFNTYLELEKTDKKRIKRAKAFFDNMVFAAEAIKNPVAFDPILLSKSINTTQSEYTPVLTGDGSQIIFTRRIHEHRGINQRQEDFYTAQLDSMGKFTTVKALEVLNTPGNEGAHTISADGNYMVFTACGRREGEGLCDLYYSKKKDGEWTDPINMGKRINSAATDREPALTADGMGLYFSSNRKGTLGGSDIWFTKRRPDGKWYIPVNLGSKINTVKNEESPFIHHDGVSLYFRSNGYPGMGGYDIYKSEWKKEWTPPKNLGYPINTEGSEGALTVSLDGEWAYYASDREDLDQEKGRDLDIFKFKLPPSIRPKEVTFVKGVILDANTDRGLSAELIIKDLNSDEAPKKLRSDAKGQYFVALPIGKKYAFTVEEEGYLFHSERFDLDSIYSVEEPFLLDIDLNPILVKKEKKEKVEFNTAIILNNIFFESGSATLLNASMSEVERLVQLLINYPSSSMTIIGYTDDIGREQDNLKLSQERAKSVKDVIVEKGIDSSRITAIGKGESDPIADNETSEGRRQNRRTTFIFNAD